MFIYYVFSTRQEGENSFEECFLVFSLAQSTKHFFGLTLKLKKLFLGLNPPPQKKMREKRIAKMERKESNVSFKKKHSKISLCSSSKHKSLEEAASWIYLEYYFRPMHRKLQTVKHNDYKLQSATVNFVRRLWDFAETHQKHATAMRWRSETKGHKTTVRLMFDRKVATSQKFTFVFLKACMPTATYMHAPFSKTLQDTKTSIKCNYYS